jgi:hypothetical protein
LNVNKPSEISGTLQWARIRRANAVAPMVDLILCPLVAPAALILRLARRLGLQRLPRCRAILMRIGLLPLRRHYYEPFITADDLRVPLDQNRDLTGINWNISGQLAFLSTLIHERELVEMAIPGRREFAFSFDNPAFAAGDAEFLYQVIRSKKPRIIIEIGSGQSTRMAHEATERNREELDGYACRHICIEPYENPWLERLGITVIRQRVEQVDNALFAQLDRDDLLFIDSSHVIKPQGDVVTEYLEILPMLRPGVIVHIHDVFSPRDYPSEWIIDKLLLWNEQYLLEAFLTHNDKWDILAALNLLKHREYEALQRVCPYLTGKREPGSIYIQRN